MQAILKFDLDDPFDQKKFKAAVSAQDLAGVIWMIREDLRHALEAKQSLADFSGTFTSALERYSINIDDLID